MKNGLVDNVGAWQAAGDLQHAALTFAELRAQGGPANVDELFAMAIAFALAHLPVVPPPNKGDDIELLHDLRFAYAGRALAWTRRRDG